MYKSAETFDDLLRSVFEHFLNTQNYFQINPRKGASREVFGALLELTNPLARLSRSELKGTPFSCLGELFWYLSGSNQLSHIQYYLKQYGRYSDDHETVYGAYGPRILNMRGEFNQLENIINFLKQQKDSRRAVIQIFDAADLINDGSDIPCTTTIQFLVRDNMLHMFVSMRSNDVYKGLPHDVFCFTMLQEIVANQLNVELGSYKHAVGSLHLYETDVEGAQNFINEGFQSTKQAMPRMPIETVIADLSSMIQLEKTIREVGYKDTQIPNINDYWHDIIILLFAFNMSKSSDNLTDLSEAKGKLKNKVYESYVEKLYQKLRSEKVSN